MRKCNQQAKIKRFSILNKYKIRRNVKRKLRKKGRLNSQNQLRRVKLRWRSKSRTNQRIILNWLTILARVADRKVLSQKLSKIPTWTLTLSTGDLH